MKWKPRVMLAGVIVLLAIVMTSLGFNAFIQSLGWMAAGYLFGSAQAAPKQNGGG